jgi:hypothetical protein
VYFINDFRANDIFPKKKEMILKFANIFDKQQIIPCFLENTPDFSEFYSSIGRIIFLSPFSAGLKGMANRNIE